jgi:hypothetical protein
MTCSSFELVELGSITFEDQVVWFAKAIGAELPVLSDPSAQA